ncbi:MAG TPA: efflux RND transporter periplasmic adaptor subunit [Terriglobales bacterium]|jgi:RND family efflux transporter MFP subunit|nr:efflux RND transporter periplasmic adaptor subunit [Terriglobales bacterium]
MRERFSRLWQQRRIAVIAVVLVTSGVVVGAVRMMGHTPPVPILTVHRGEFVDSVQFRGEVKALKSVEINAPAEAGELQILKIAADGTQVKKGDSIVEFDKTKTDQDLAQFRSGLKSAEAEIDQARAQARLTEEEDSTAVAKARYDVEVAKLDASKQEIVSKIEGAEAKLKVADAEQKLHEAEQKLASDRISSKATIQSKIDASQKAAYDVERTERALTKMALTAPLSGMVSLVRIWHPEGQSAFKPGDRTWPGAPIAELPDVSTLRITARVEETDRGRLAIQQPVAVHLDAIVDRQFNGKIEKISTIASSDFTGGWPFPRNFDLSIALDETDPRLKPGMTAQMTVVVERIANAITLPAQASFQKSGQSVAYIWDGSKFQERAIEIGRRSGDRVLVTKGLNPDERVALQDPLGGNSQP